MSRFPRPAASLAALCKGLIGLCALLCLASFAQAAAPSDEGDFHGLPQFQSRGGLLSVSLTAEERPVTVDGIKLDAMVFNGVYGGPVLRVRPGDRVRIHLLNRLKIAANLHFHGMHTSPLDRGDNVHVVVAPGGSFDYDFVVPKSQPPGIYWYHTHIHGQSEAQVGRGLSGALIVDGLEARVPEAAGLRQRLLVMQSFTPPETDQTPELKVLHGVVQTINGQAHTVIQAHAGARELWRISNQNANTYYHLSAPGFRFRIVALDGAPTNQDLPVTTLDLGPAGRAEVLVDVPAAGSYPLLSGSTPTGLGKQLALKRELALIQVSGDAAAAPEAPVQVRVAATPDLRQAAIAAHRLVVVGQVPAQEIWTINGKTFDHERIDARIPLGSTEEWVIRNDTDDMHVFHIHQVHFQVVAINGEPQPFDRVLDTVRVPERGEVTIRIAFTDPQIVGRFVFHCHVLKHEDKGMMANVEVYDPKAPQTAAATVLHGASYLPGIGWICRTLIRPTSGPAPAAAGAKPARS